MKLFLITNRVYKFYSHSYTKKTLSYSVDQIANADFRYNDMQINIESNEIYS